MPEGIQLFHMCVYKEKEANQIYKKKKNAEA